MVLVTGPTGSGKTSTLYAALELLNKPEHKIITVEDPVEYRLSRVNQVQIHPQIGLTFARVLRSALRQDPDVVLVGEMRDEETAEIGARAAMTGHMVLSTLHTNDAISTVTRLVDMGVKSYLLASVLHAILAQRLVRRVCKSCAQPVDARPADRGVGARQGRRRSQRSRVCARCRLSPLQQHRLQRADWIYQLLELDSEMSDALGQGDRSRFVDAARSAAGYQSLDEAALVYAGKGITSLNEAMRLAADLGGDDVPDMDWQTASAAA